MVALVIAASMCFVGTIAQGILMIWRGYSTPRLFGLIVGIALTIGLMVTGWLAMLRAVI